MNLEKYSVATIGYNSEVGLIFESWRKFNLKSTSVCVRPDIHITTI